MPPIQAETPMTNPDSPRPNSESDCTAVSSPDTMCFEKRNDELMNLESGQSDINETETPTRKSVFRKGVSSLLCLIGQGKDWMFSNGSGATQMPPMSPLVRSLNEFESGYPNLAAFKDSSECFMVYRRFGYLQARLLLDRQHELGLLEEDLDQFDRDSKNVNQLTSLAGSEEEMKPRRELFEKIEKSYTSYASVLTAAHQMMAFYRPSESEHQSISNYLYNQRPIHKSERSYIRHKEDLVTLRPGREHAWLDRAIEYTLKVLHKPFPVLNRWFCSETTRLKSRDGDEVYYSRERINLCASFIITMMILALLIVPIYLLYHLATTTNGTFSGNATSICIGILLVFTLAFSAVLSLFTRAKRHEILGAAAAYCAVLVVFLGNVH